MFCHQMFRSSHCYGFCPSNCVFGVVCLAFFISINFHDRRDNTEVHCRLVHLKNTHSHCRLVSRKIHYVDLFQRVRWSCCTIDFLWLSSNWRNWDDETEVEYICKTSREERDGEVRRTSSAFVMAARGSHVFFALLRAGLGSVDHAQTTFSVSRFAPSRKW